MIFLGSDFRLVLKEELSTDSETKVPIKKETKYIKSKKEWLKSFQEVFFM